MLNAEHVALESRLVQQMVAIRQREMDGLLTRYSAIGTQASLLAGFAITQLTALTPSDEHVAPPVQYIFYITSLACVLSSMHVVTCTMFVCNWAPRLALRGPTGSLTRAYEATKSEKRQLNISFTLSTVSFALQTVAAIWVMDHEPRVTPICMIATVGTLSLVAVDVYYHRQIHKRFFGDHGEWGTRPNQRAERETQRRMPLRERQRLMASSTLQRATEPLLSHSTPPQGSVNGSTRATNDMPISEEPGRSTGVQSASVLSTSPQRERTGQRQAADAGGGRRPSILNNPLANIDYNPDAVNHGEQLLPARVGGSELNHCGMLSKRSQQVGDGAAASSPRPRMSTATLRRLASSVAGEWNERFFVLQDGQLNYWHSEADYDLGKPPRLEEPIDLSGHEVLVDTDSPKWAFTLTPVRRTSGSRTWHFRAPSEEARLVWARKLVTNALIHGDGED